MISDSPKHLLFIEPTKPPAKEPIVDDITRRMTGAWRQRLTSDDGYRGVHFSTAPGSQATSDNHDHWVAAADGQWLVTNSLAIHYLAFHRDEVPQAEIDKVLQLTAEPATPTPGEMDSEAANIGAAAAEDFKAHVSAHGRASLPNAYQ